MTNIKRLPLVPPALPEDVDGTIYKAILFEWHSIVVDYEDAPGDPVNAWRYLAQHPVFWEVEKGSSGPSYLLPGTAWYRAIESGFDRHGHAGVAVWMEAVRCRWHSDPTLEEMEAADPAAVECIGVDLPTYEEALTALARRVHDTWGNDRESLKLPELEERWRG